MKPRKLDFPLTKDIKIPATIQLINHRDKSKSIILNTVIDDGKPLKLEAKCVPQKKKDFWHIKCGVWETGSTTEDLHETVAYLFRSNIEVFNSFIEANKYVEVSVRIPKGNYCDGCPMFHIDESAVCCQYLPNKPDIFFNFEDGKNKPTKHKDCPAISES